MTLPIVGFVILIIVLCALVFLLVHTILSSRKAKDSYLSSIEEMEESIAELEKSHEHGLISQRGQLVGDALEKFLPLFPGYKYNLRDVHYLKDTCDFIVFNGRTESNGAEIKELVFQEIKTGEADLSNVQKALRACIENKAIRFEEIHISQQADKFYLWQRIRRPNPSSKE